MLVSTVEKFLFVLIIFFSLKVSAKDFDMEITAALKAHNVDLVLLIGFMRILSEKFCSAWRDRLLNVHPSLLPKYAGGMDMNVHREVLHNGDAETGCTIHFVTDEVDAGPILAQAAVEIRDDDDETSLHERIKLVERDLYPTTIKKFLAELEITT